MHVDRRRFLDLVTALACVPTLHCATTPPESQVVVAPLDIKPLSVDAGGPLAILATPPDAAAAAPPPSGSSSLGIWGLAYDPAAAAKSCAQLRCPGPSQEAMGALRSQCKALSDTLRTEPFQRFMTCMMSANNTSSTCDLAGRHGGGRVPRELGVASHARSRDSLEVHAHRGRVQRPEAERVRRGNALDGDVPAHLQRHVREGRAGEWRMIHCVTEYCGGAPGLCYMASMY